MSSTLTRRALGRLLGVSAGAALLDTRLSPMLHAAPSPSASDRPIRLSANENPYGPCAASLEALTRSAGEASRYPGAIESEVRSAIARLHGVKVEQIVLGCGSSDVLRMADSAFVAAGKTIVAAEPTFEAVLNYAKVTRAEAVKIPLTADFRHNLPKMAAACDSRTGIAYVCNPNNPTGTVVSADELETFVKRVPPTCVVLVDEAYHHFVDSPKYKSALELPGRHDNVVVARTFSKIYGMAGMRLGYAVASAANADLMQQQASWDNTNQSALAMGLAALSDADVVPRQRKLLNETRTWLCAQLEHDGRRYIPSEANFVMIDVQGDVTPVAQSLRERGVQAGRKFPSMGNWLRVSIGKREEMEAFLAGLRAIVPASAAA